MHHNILSLRNQSLTLLAPPHPLYTVDRRESALVLIRIWLCSASRVQQPNRPVSGIPASPTANRRVLALFRSSGKVASVESGWRLAPSRRIGCRRGSRVPQSHAGPPRQPYPIEIPTLTQKALEPSGSVPSGRRILPKRPSRCVSQSRPTDATQ